MKFILLSGGSGKRLWPLSNDSRSKQFLKVLPGPEGQSESMVQRVWRQMEQVGLAQHSYILTGKAQSEMIHSQLNPDVPLIVEPDRRDTYAAIMLGVSYLLTETAASADEAVVIMPVDPYVHEDFFKTILRLESVLQDNGPTLALIGAEPTLPSNKYGYMVTEEQVGDVRKVKRFIEKPNPSVAQNLIEQGALWNCGVFAGRLSFFEQLLRDKGLPADYRELRARYDSIPKNSFDYEVVEHLQDIAVMPYNGYWKDLGTWNALTEEMDGPVSGKGVCSSDSVNTHIVNELDIPIAVLGVSNLIVAASPDGILVADKEASPRIKEVLGNDLSRPMFVERFWGWYRVLEYGQNNEGMEVLVRRVCIQEGKNISYHKHAKRQENWTITSGVGALIIGTQVRMVRSGDQIEIPIGTPHSIRAIQELQLIETQLGSELVESDVHRIAVNWADIMEVIRD